MLIYRKSFGEIIGAVWLHCLNNSFRCLNNATRISTIFFHPHVFSQHLNNVTRTTLPNGPLYFMVFDNFKLFLLRFPFWHQCIGFVYLVVSSFCFPFRYFYHILPMRKRLSPLVLFIRLKYTVGPQSLGLFSFLELYISEFSFGLLCLIPFSYWFFTFQTFHFDPSCLI